MRLFFVAVFLFCFAMVSCAATLVIPPCPSQPDLTIASLEFSPVAPNCSDVMTVRAVVRNVGTAAVSGAVVAMKLDGVERVRVIGPNISVNATWATPWFVLGVLGPGSFDVTYCADPDGVIVEVNEGNNCR